jgi:adenosylcobinamide-phosphate synthase
VVAAPAGVATGYVADALLGDPARWHPVAGFGQLAAAVESKVWQPTRRAGAAFAGVLVGASWACGATLAHTTRRRPALGVATAGAALWMALGARSLGREARAVEGALATGDLTLARSRAQRIVGRDLSQASVTDVARAVVESVAENTADATVAPLLWAATAGPAGALAYRAANTLDAMVGHRVERYARFGWAAARLDDLMTWPAARVGALATACVASLVGGEGRSTVRIVRRDGGRHPSPNAGLMEAAFAGALGVRLGGVNTYFGVSEERPTLGDGHPPAPSDIGRAVRLAEGCGLVSAMIASLVAWGLAR